MGYRPFCKYCNVKRLILPIISDALLQYNPSAAAKLINPLGIASIMHFNFN